MHDTSEDPYEGFVLDMRSSGWARNFCNFYIHLADWFYIVGI